MRVAVAVVTLAVAGVLAVASAWLVAGGNAPPAPGDTSVLADASRQEDTTVSPDTGEGSATAPEGKGDDEGPQAAGEAGTDGPVQTGATSVTGEADQTDDDAGRTDDDAGQTDGVAGQTDADGTPEQPDTARGSGASGEAEPPQAGIVASELESLAAEAGVAVRVERQDEEVDVVAEAILGLYEREGHCLLAAAGYLDVLGDVWGCVVEGPGWVDVSVAQEGADGSCTVRTVRLLPEEGLVDDGT